MESTVSDIENMFGKKYIETSNKGHTPEPGIHEISNNKYMLKSLLPENIKVNVTLDDIRLKSNLFTNKTDKITKNCFSIQYWDLFNLIRAPWVISMDIFKY